jgi:hypothetical protein
MFAGFGQLGKPHESFPIDHHQGSKVRRPMAVVLFGALSQSAPSAEQLKDQPRIHGRRGNCATMDGRTNDELHLTVSLLVLYSRYRKCLFLVCFLDIGLIFGSTILTLVNPAAIPTPERPDGKPKKVLPPTPVRFPQCTPRTEEKILSSPRGNVPLAKLLQTIHRPADIQLSHFEALGVHVISDALPRDILPDSGFLPPSEEWLALRPEELEEKNEASKRLLNNGKLSPGVQTYIERRNELSIDNTAAYRTVQRVPTPAGETAVRLGNAYGFFKNLELFSSYWQDTSLPIKPDSQSLDSPSVDGREGKMATTFLPPHDRIGTGSQLPAEFRQQLLTTYIKMIAYDFGCNVAFSRCEPRLHLAPPPPSPPSFFNSSASFILRTPTDPASARSGIVEGPVAAVSCRTSTVFATEAESVLDFGREVVAVLLTAQQRAREGKSEKRFGADAWWTSKPRWGGGPGGPIGRETDAPEELLIAPGVEKIPTISDIRKAIGGINGPVVGKKGKRAGTSQIYDNYRKLLPPSSSWDRRARYSAIGKARGAEADDIFLISAINHHISIVRARVPDSLLRALDGEDAEWERMVMWRSRWFDLFLKEDRVQGMDLIWGMMSWLMRSESPEQGKDGEERDKMDLDGGCY